MTTNFRRTVTEFKDIAPAPLAPLADMTSAALGAAALAGGKSSAGQPRCLCGGEFEYRRQTQRRRTAAGERVVDIDVRECVYRRSGEHGERALAVYREVAPLLRAAAAMSAAVRRELGVDDVAKHFRLFDDGCPACGESFADFTRHYKTCTDLKYTCGVALQARLAGAAEATERREATLDAGAPVWAARGMGLVEPPTRRRRLGPDAECAVYVLTPRENIATAARLREHVAAWRADGWTPAFIERLVDDGLARIASFGPERFEAAAADEERRLLSQ